MIKYFEWYLDTFSAPSKEEINTMLDAEKDIFHDKTYEQVRNHINNKNKTNKNKTNKKYGKKKISNQLTQLL